VRVLVPYDRDKYQELRHQAEGGLPWSEARGWFAEAAPLAVNIYRPGRDADTSALQPVFVGGGERPDGEADWYVLLDDDPAKPLYDRNVLGLRGIRGSWIV
jgi:hypothetical protein